jgi:hypothetical protein
VRFRKANVIYIEDFYRNFGYPFADQANGGTITGMLDAVDLFDRVADANTTLIPGHGTLVRKRDLLPYRAMLVEVVDKVKRLRDDRKVAQGGACRQSDGTVRPDRPWRHATEQGSFHHGGLRRGEELRADRRREANDADRPVEMSISRRSVFFHRVRAVPLST